MSRPLRVLIVEDNPDDAEMMIHSLHRNGIEPAWQRAETADELKSALAAGIWDAVLLDYTLPRFGIDAALEIIHTTDPDMPVLVVSGTMGEERAVETMRAGASDYVLKNNLVRLGPALEREVRAADNRRTQRKTQQLISRLAAIVESADDAIISCTLDGTITDFNAGAERLYGYSAAEVVGLSIPPFVPADRLAQRQENLARLGRGERVEPIEDVRCRRDGTRVEVMVSVSPMRDADGRIFGASNIVRDITARKFVENALQKSETRYRRLFEAAQDGVLIVDAVSRQILDANPFLANLLGCRCEDLVGKELWEIGMFRDIEANKAAFRTLQEVGYVRYDDHPLIAKDGRQIDVEFVSNAYEVDGVRKIQCNIRDISDQRRAEALLRASEARFKALVEKSFDAVALLDADGTISYITPAVERNSGWAPHEFLGKKYYEWKHPDDLVLTAARHATLLQHPGGSFTGQTRLRHKDGSYIWTESTVTNLLADPDVNALVVNIRDITDRKRAEEAVRASEERFRAFMDNSPAASDIKDEDGRLLYVNAAWRRQFNPEPIDWLGKTNYDYWPRETADLFRASDLQCLARNAAIQMEETGRTASGQERTFLVMKFPVPNGGLRQVGGMAWDITDRTQAEAALRLRDRAIQAATQGLTITDPAQADNPTIYTSPSFERITGYKSEEILGRNLRFIQGKDTDPATVARLSAAVKAGEPCAVELLNYRKDGTPFWNELSISPVRDEAGHLTHFVGVQVDVTARRALEEQFRQAQKMDAFGQLAGGVAHDFNNLITIINGYSEIVLLGLSPNDKLRGFVKEIIQAGQRSAALTAQLLAFSRKQVVVLKILDINNVVRDTEKMLRRIIGEDIELVTTLSDDAGSVRADAGQLEQVLLNLSVNARDAMPQGGKLTIETKNVELETDYAKLHVNARRGSHVLLAVSDTGCGMTEEVKKRIFEPFFTTKGVGEGTGLGLATVFGIVSQAEGRIEVYSEVNVGTSFKIYLPRVNRVVKLNSDSVHLDPIPQGTESVLLVEDEPGVRELLYQILNDCGYCVSTAASGIDAIQLTQEHRGTFDLIVTDVVMPGMSGRQMVEKLVGQYPRVKVLYMSGYTDDAVVRHGILHEHVHYLQKPFSPSALARKVRNLLDS